MSLPDVVKGDPHVAAHNNERHQINALTNNRAGEIFTSAEFPNYGKFRLISKDDPSQGTVLVLQSREDDGDDEPSWFNIAEWTGGTTADENTLDLKGHTAIHRIDGGTGDGGLYLYWGPPNATLATAQYKGRVSVADEPLIIFEVFDPESEEWMSAGYVGKDVSYFPGGVQSAKFMAQMAQPGSTNNFAPVLYGAQQYLFNLTANMAIAVPTGGAALGQEVTFVLKQDATGGRVVTFAAGFKKATGLVLPTAANTHNIITFVNTDGAGTWSQKSVSLGMPN